MAHSEETPARNSSDYFHRRGDPTLGDAQQTNEAIAMLFERRDVYVRDTVLLQKLQDPESGYRQVASVNIMAHHFRRGSAPNNGSKWFKYAELSKVARAVVLDFFAIASEYAGHVEEKFGKALGDAAQVARDETDLLADMADEADAMEVDGAHTASSGQQYDSHVTYEPLLSSDGQDRHVGFRLTLHARYALERTTMEAVEAAADSKAAARFKLRARTWQQRRAQIKKLRLAALGKFETARSKEVTQWNKEQARRGAIKRSKPAGRRGRPPPPKRTRRDTAAAGAAADDVPALSMGDTAIPSTRSRIRKPVGGGDGDAPSSSDELSADAADEEEEEEAAPEFESALDFDEFCANKYPTLGEATRFMARNGPEALDKDARRRQNMLWNGMRILEAERAWVSERFGKLKEKDKRAIFGTAPPYYRAEYDYLRVRAQADWAKDVAVFYYGDELNTMKVDDERPLRAATQMQVLTGDVSKLLLANAFTAADALVYGGILGDSNAVHPQHYDPSLYYPASFGPGTVAALVAPQTRAVVAQQRKRVDDERAMDLEDDTPPLPVKQARPLDEFRRHLRSTMRELSTPGAPSPSAYPRADTVLFIKPAYCLPEVIRDLFLPYAVNEPVEQAVLVDYAETLDDLVDDAYYQRLFAQHLVLRHATSHYATPEGIQNLTITAAAGMNRLQGIDEETEADARRRARYHGIPDAGEMNHAQLANALIQRVGMEDSDVRNVVLATLLRDQETTARRVANVDELRRDRPRLLVFANEKKFIAERRLRNFAQTWRGARYPGLLNTGRSANEEALRVAEREREQVYLVPVAPDGEARPTDPAALEAYMLRAIDNHEALDITEWQRTANNPYANRLGGGVGDDEDGYDADRPEGAKTAAQVADELRYKKALACRTTSVGSNIPDSILKQSAINQMSIINNHRFRAVHEKIRQAGDAMAMSERRALLYAAVMEAAYETYDCFMKTMNESTTFYTIRESARQLIRSEQGLFIKPQRQVNGDNTTTYLTWLEHTTMPVYNVSSRAQNALRLLMASSDSHMYMPVLGGNEVAPNSLFAGRYSVGKSFALSTNQQMLLPGTCLNFSHVTAHALASGKNNSFGIYVFHEAPSAFFIDPNDKSNKKMDKSAGGDPQKVQILKNMLTEHSLTTMTLMIDEKTGERRTVVHQSLTYNLWQFAINWEVALISGPVKSRVNIYEFRVTSFEQRGGASSSGAVTTNTLESTRVAQDIHDISITQQKLHTEATIVNYLLAAGAIPDGIIMENASCFISDVQSRLINDFNFSKDTFDTRFRQRTNAMGRNLTVRSTCASLLATAYGHHFLQRHGLQPASIEAIVGFIYPRLFMPISHMTYAWSLVDFHYDSTETRDVFLVLASDTFLRSANYHDHRPLVRKNGSDLPGQQSLTDKYIIGPQLQRAIQRPPPPPSPSTTTTTGRGGGGGNGPAMSSGGPLIEDHRYLVYKYPSTQKAFYDSILAQLDARRQYSIRPEAVEDIIKMHREQRIKSPYYTRDENRELSVVLDSAGNVPTDDIPIVRVYADESIVAVSVQFLSARFSLPMIRDEGQRLLEVVRQQHVSKSYLELFEAKMHQSADERLKVPMINSLNLKMGESIEQMAEVSLIDHPAGIAMVGALSAANLGRTSLPGEKHYDSKWEQARKSMRFLTAWAPANFILDVDPRDELNPRDQRRYDALVAGEGVLTLPAHQSRMIQRNVFLVMSSFMQTLTATRSTNPANLPTFEHGRHLGTTAANQLRDTLPNASRFTKPEAGSLVDALRADTKKFELDYDFLSALARLASLGQLHPDRTAETILAKLGVPPHEPSTYPPNDNLVFALYDRRARAHEAATRAAAAAAPVEATDEDDDEDDDNGLLDDDGVPRTDRRNRYPQRDIRELIQRQTDGVMRQSKGLLHTYKRVEVTIFGRSVREVMEEDAAHRDRQRQQQQQPPPPPPPAVDAMEEDNPDFSD
jgi:hypothetical protein